MLVGSALLFHSASLPSLGSGVRPRRFRCANRLIHRDGWWRARVRRLQPARAPAVLMAGGRPDERDDPDKSDERGKENRGREDEFSVSEDAGGKSGPDWNEQWREYVARLKVEAPAEQPVDRSGDPVLPSIRELDRRTERLTAAWTSERGYLLAIVGIGFIACFYLSVMKEQGIF